MRKVFIGIALLLLLPAAVMAQAITTVTGTIQSATGGIATSGYVEFRISPASNAVQYFVLGTAIIAPQTSRCGINSSGAVVNATLTGACQVWGNPSISPANTAYTVVFAPANAVTNTVARQLITGSSYSLNSPVFTPSIAIVPQSATVNTPPANANIVPIAPNAFTVGSALLPYASGYFNTLFANNLAIPLSSVTAGDVSVETLNGIRFCDRFPGADASFKIKAAISDLPAEGGVVDCTGLTGAQTWSTDPFDITPVSPATVRLFLGGAMTVTASASATMTANITMDMGNATINMAVGRTLSMLSGSQLIATAKRHFGTSGAYSLIVDEMRPEWWGWEVTSSAATNNAAMIAALGAFGVKPRCGPLRFGSATVSTTVGGSSIDGRRGCIFRGFGTPISLSSNARTTMLTWSGGASTVVNIQGCYTCAVSDFAIDGANLADTGLAVTSPAGAVSTSQQNQYKNIFITNITAGNGRGLYVGDPDPHSGMGGQVSDHTFDKVFIINTKTAVYHEGQATLTISYRNFSITTVTTAGFDFVSGNAFVGQSTVVSALTGTLGGFVVRNGAGNMEFDDAYMESSFGVRCFYFPGVVDANGPSITIIKPSCASNNAGGAANVLTWTQNGPLTIIGGQFSSGLGGTASFAPLGTAATGKVGVIHSENNTWTNAAPTTAGAVSFVADFRDANVSSNYAGKLAACTSCPSYSQQIVNTNLQLINSPLSHTDGTTRFDEVVNSTEWLVRKNGSVVGGWMDSTAPASLTSSTFSARNINAANVTGAAAGVLKIGSSDVGFGNIFCDYTNTAAGTTGNQTINKPCGSVNFAAGTGTGGLTVTNSKSTSSAMIFCDVQTNDATATSCRVQAQAGQFVIRTNANATAETNVRFFLVNTN